VLGHHRILASALGFARITGNDAARPRNSPLTFGEGGRLDRQMPIERSRSMGKVVITTNVSLDGVVQDPDGREGFRHGGWFNESGGEDLGAWAQLETDEALGAAALLLGRRSDEWFAERWLARDGAWADKLNSLPKYVVSSALERPRWGNATVLKGDVAREVTALKQELDGEILVYASYQLARALLEHDLVDELRLVVFPVVLGVGERLFGETSDKKPMRLVDTRPVGSGLVYLSYELVRDDA
jgi:dihydrofolate reductase